MYLRKIWNLCKWNFGSLKYDLNLIKLKFVECLDFVNFKKNFIVKKCN